MATINDLLYNYQETNEFVCSDGRMSVNGICQVEQPADSVDTSITEEITHDGDDNEIVIDTEKVKRDKILKDLEGTSDYFPELGKEKEKINPEINQEVISPHLIDQSIVPTSDIKHSPSESITHNKIPIINKTLDKVESIIEKTAPKKEKFEWDFDKEKKIDTYKHTVNSNINAYNNWVETNLGISTDIQNAARVGGTAAALAGGSGILAAVAPWALPVFLGGAINRAERERIENITDQDKQGDIQTVDMMTYNTPDGPGSWGGHGSVEAYDKSQAETYSRAKDRHDW